MAVNPEHYLIAESYFDEEFNLVKQKRFMLKYFTTKIEQVFLVYTALVGKTGYKNFVNHTGLLCSERWYGKMLELYTKLEKKCEIAQNTFDLDTLASAKQGKLKRKEIKVPTKKKGRPRSNKNVT